MHKLYFKSFYYLKTFYIKGYAIYRHEYFKANRQTAREIFKK